MVNLEIIINKLDSYFEIERFGPDASMSKFVPMVFDGYLDWRNFFEREFSSLFNGLMIKGDPLVNQVFTAVFPTNEIVESFINMSKPGDLLFLHHPIIMSCGDPQGEWGKGFLPINKELLEKIKEKRLSIYSCHAPLDFNQVVGTNEAIVKALNVTKIDNFGKANEGFVGRIGKISPLSTDEIISRLKELFEISYVDFEGKKHGQVAKLAIIAGSGDKIQYFEEAEKMGAQVYITGEIHSHIDNEKGRSKMAEAKEYASKTSMSLVGVSHAASEYLVMKNQMPEFFKTQLNLKTVPIPMTKWWY